MRMNTDHLLTLGMALTTDKRAMERRVRGVFARKRSAKSVLALSVLLALALGFAAFTTACQPGQTIVSNSNAAVSGGNAFASGGNALASGGDVTVEVPTDAAALPTKEMVMTRLKQTLQYAREYHVPRMENIVEPELGTWTKQQNPNDADRLKAAYQFLEIANAIFTKNYTSNDLTTTYYDDSTGFRSDLWRFDSKDGVLSGALESETLRFLSADCLNEPGDTLHPSLQKDATRNTHNLDTTVVAERIAGILKTGVKSSENIGGGGYVNGTEPWHFNAVTDVVLSNDSYCAICVFGDENLTPTTVCVYPDIDCSRERVFWRADLQMTDGVTKLLYPQKFRRGTPGADDMPLSQVVDFYNKLISLAGQTDLAKYEHPVEFSATFYVDYSGARENYWHIEDGIISFDLTSKTGHMLHLSVNGNFGKQLGLTNIPYENMGGEEYMKATNTFFTGLYGKDAVKLVAVNAVYDEHYCTMDPFMADGSSYEIMYQDGLIQGATFLCSSDPSRWTSVPDWLQKWAKTDSKTGMITVQGMKNGKDRYLPDWLADWVYINNETGEIFAMEW